MNHFAEAFAWCMLQVTLFTLAAVGLYGMVVRFRLAGAVTVLITSLAIVGLLSLLCVSPWPQWFTSPKVAVVERISLVSRDRRPQREQGNQAIPLLARRASIPVDHVEAASPNNLGAENRNATDLHRSDNQAADQIFDFGHGRIRNVSTVIVGLAAIAAAIGCVRLLAGMISLRRYLQSSIPIDDCNMREQVTELTSSLALRRAVGVRASASLQVPATAGWRRPVILLPAAWREWTPEQLRAVVAHELAHVAQRHFPVWVLSQLPLVAHYYHPLVHWLVRRLRLEQELAADTLAANVFGGRRQYATVLAGLALHTAAPSGPFASLGLFMSRPFLMRRIDMLRESTETPVRISRMSRAILLIALAATGGIIAGLRTSSAEEADRPVTSVTNPAQEPNGTSKSASAASPIPPSPAADGNAAPIYVGDEQQGPSAEALLQVSRISPTLTSAGAKLNLTQNGKYSAKRSSPS